MTNNKVIPRVGLRFEFQGDVKVVKFTESDIKCTFTDGTYTTIPLRDSYVFKPDNDLEWIAVNRPTWGCDKYNTVTLFGGNMTNYSDDGDYTRQQVEAKQCDLFGITEELGDIAKEEVKHTGLSDEFEALFWEYDKEIVNCDSKRMLFKKYMAKASLLSDLGHIITSGKDSCGSCRMMCSCGTHFNTDPVNVKASNEWIEKHQICKAGSLSKPLYTQEMSDNGELPPVGSEAAYMVMSKCATTDYENDCDGAIFEIVAHHNGIAVGVSVDEDGCSERCVMANHAWWNPVKTYQEKLIDEISNVLHMKGFSHDNLMIKCLISHGYITRKDSDTNESN